MASPSNCLRVAMAAKQLPTAVQTDSELSWGGLEHEAKVNISGGVQRG